MSNGETPSIRVIICDVCGDEEEAHHYNRTTLTVETVARDFQGQPCASIVHKRDLCDVCGKGITDAINVMAANLNENKGVERSLDRAMEHQQ